MSTLIASPIKRRHFFYTEDYLPESDGRPMAETDRHRDLMLGLLHALKERFRKNLRVKEYFIFDPYRDAQPAALAGFQLENGEYAPMLVARHNGSLHLRSKILGLELRVEKGDLRLYDPKTGERLRTPAEAEEDRRTAEIKAAAAEAEVIRLRKTLAKLQHRKK